ncbi:hypothetical protein [Roseobacter sp.]|uniref:hypothetical protein n=1 Tax=Roseobacter sp. TaxID=1907202 RepID=UPI0025DB455C|nr:hypothetical protein [Roseobacter sp.]
MTGARIKRSEENDAVYRQIRNEIQFELSLINARVNWLVTSQAFLFVPLTLGARDGGIGASVYYPVIPVLGVAICSLVLISVMAAVWRSHQWRAKACQGAYDGRSNDATFDIILPHRPLIPRMGLIGGVGVPVILVLVWFWLLIAPPGT